MIVVSQNLTLSASDKNSPVFGLHNVVTTLNVTATNPDAAFPVTNLANPATNLEWRGSALTSTTITVDNSLTVGDVDYIAIARHNFGSGRVAVSLQLVSPALVVTTEVPSFTPADNSPLIFRFPAQAVREFRLVLTPVAVKPRAAVVYAGKLLVSQRRIYVGHTPLPMGRTTMATNGFSENGEFLGRIILQESVSTGVSLQNLTPSWYRSSFDPFLKKAKAVPFFFAWRPTTYPTECGYVWLTSDPRPSNQRVNGMMQVDFQVKGIV